MKESFSVNISFFPPSEVTLVGFLVREDKYETIMANTILKSLQDID